MTENDLQSLVIQSAKAAGWRVYHTYDSRRSEAGFPDLVMFRDRSVLWIELKSDTGRIRPEQQDWLDGLARAGQVVHLWRPADWLDGTVNDVLAAASHGPPAGSPLHRDLDAAREDAKFARKQAEEWRRYAGECNAARLGIGELGTEMDAVKAGVDQLSRGVAELRERVAAAVALADPETVASGEPTT